MDGDGRGGRGLEALLQTLRGAVPEHARSVGNHFGPADTDPVFGGRLLGRLPESADSGIHEIRGAGTAWFAASTVCCSGEKERQKRGAGVSESRTGTQR